MIEFTGTLIENELEELIIISKVACPYIRSIRAFTKLVNPIDSALLAGSNHGWICSITTTSPVIPVIMQTNHALGIHQIDISQTEERKIGFYTCIGSIRCCSTIILQVAPLLRKIAGGFIGHAGYILALTIGKELATLVTIAINIGLGKLIHELRTKTEFTPTGSYTIIGYILVGIRHTYLSTNQISR